MKNSTSHIQEDLGERGKLSFPSSYLGKSQVESIEKPQFKSSFKTWMRVVAFIVVAVFLPEQAAQAVEYDWRVLWHKPAASAFVPAYLQNATNIDIPLAVKNILKDVSGKSVTAIRISPTLSVELGKPLNISQQRIEEIYNWLKGRPCGSKALYDLLNSNGIQAGEQDIAVFALTIDILNDIVKPEGNPEVIKNSIYALSKAAEFFGLKLYPAKVSGLLPDSKDLTPFIAHLNNDHYVLVTNITPDKVYYVNEHKEEFLPKEKFFARFSGYALVSRLSAPFEAINEAEAKKVMGASDWGDSYDYDSGSYASSYAYSNNYGYTGVDYSSNNANLGLTNQITGNPSGISMTLYNGANTNTIQTVWGFNTQYTSPSTGNYASFNTLLTSPVTGYYENNALVRGRYGNIALTPGNNFAAIPITGINTWKIGDTSGAVPYATMSKDFTKFDDRAAVWIGSAPTQIFSQSLNLNKDSFYATKWATNENLPVWHITPTMNTFFNPGQINTDTYTPPSGAPIAVPSQFSINPVVKGNELGIKEGFMGMGALQNGSFQININNAGVTLRPGSIIGVSKEYKTYLPTMEALSPTTEKGNLNPAFNNFIPGQTFELASPGESQFYFHPAVQEGGSLVLQPGQGISGIANTGRSDVRFVGTG